MIFKHKLAALAFSMVASFNLLSASAYAAEDTIKVGIMHSTSGTMAISEATLKDVMLMLIEEQNAKGGLLGKKLEPVVVDPSSIWPIFLEKSRELLSEDKVAVVFGCWTSVSRKAVLPVFEELNGLLFYPLQNEGEESSRNIIYTGAVPNQQVIPGIEYLKKVKGIERWVLAGTDYVFPRTTNKIIEAYLKAQGVSHDDIMINYTPFGHENWDTIVSDIKAFGSQGKKTAVLSTLNGDANVYFYKELAKQGISAKDIPVMAFSVGEEELATLDAKALQGHLATWNYFMTIDTKANHDFIKKYQAFSHKDHEVTNDPMEAHYIGFNLWVEAVNKAKSTEVDKVLDAMVGLETKSLSGTVAKVLPNHHITKPVYIGEITKDGQFNIVYKSKDTIEGDPWSDYLPESKNLKADWTNPINCGNYDVVKKKCLATE